jgi:hypothetical protein
MPALPLCAPMLGVHKKIKLATKSVINFAKRRKTYAPFCGILFRRHLLSESKLKVTAQISPEIRQIIMPVGCKAKNVSLQVFSACLQALML